MIIKFPVTAEIRIRKTQNWMHWITKRHAELKNKPPKEVRPLVYYREHVQISKKRNNEVSV